MSDRECSLTGAEIGAAEKVEMLEKVEEDEKEIPSSSKDKLANST